MEAKGVGQAELAKAASVSRQRINDYYLGRKTPQADTLYALEDALGVRGRWLIRGEGERDLTARNVSGDDWIFLPRYDLFDFADGVTPEPIEMVQMRRGAVLATARTLTGLWLAEMPSDAMPDLAREGDLIICRAPDFPLADGRIYAFLLDGRAIVRSVQARPDGLVLKATAPAIDPITLAGDHLELLTPIGRVLAALNLKAA